MEQKLNTSNTLVMSNWDQIDANVNSFSGAVNENELFAADLFGNELIDLYGVTEGSTSSDQVEIVKKNPEKEVLEDDPAIPELVPSLSNVMDFSDMLPSLDSIVSAAKASKLVPKTMKRKLEDGNISSKVTSTSPGASASASTKKLTLTKQRRKAGLLSSKNGTNSPFAMSSNSITGQAAAFIMRQKELSNQVQRNFSTTISEVRSGITTPPVESSNPTIISPVNNSLPFILSDSAMATAAAVAAASRPKTEADFAAVAHAAVSSLILSAGSNNTGTKEVTQNIDDEDSDGPINFSTAVNTTTGHISALTSSNWMAACSSNTSSSPTVDDEPINKKRRESLTPDERAKQNRVRNREHARNTRLRKKAYVEELKRTLTELVAQRDAADFERRHAAQRDLEQREVRFRVMEEFLRLRGTNESNVSKWIAILEDNFVLKLPLTHYRGMVKKGVESVKTPFSLANNEQVLHGAADAIADAACLSEMLKSLSELGDNELIDNKISVSYECDRKLFFMDGCSAVLDWSATIERCVNGVSINKFIINGTMKAMFSPASNKLITCKLVFDTGAIFEQLRALNPTVHDCERMITPTNEMSAQDAHALIDSIEMDCLSAIHNQDVASVTASENSDPGLADLHNIRVTRV